MILRKKGLVKKLITEKLEIELEKNFISDKIYQYHIGTFEGGDHEGIFEDLDTYIRIHILRHLGKTGLCTKVFTHFENLFSCKNLYK